MMTRGRAAFGFTTTRYGKTAALSLMFITAPVHSRSPKSGITSVVATPASGRACCCFGATKGGFLGVARGSISMGMASLALAGDVAIAVAVVVGTVAGWDTTGAAACAIGETRSGVTR